MDDLKKLYEQLKSLHQDLRNFQKEKWDRSVSFEDELFNRFEKAKFLGFGDGTSIYQDSLVIGDVKVGTDSWIGPYTVLDGSGGLTIGNNCSISSGVQLYSHDTVKRRLSDGHIGIEKAPTKIGNSCYIGPLSVVQKGVEIGDYVVIGAHSFVNRDVPSFSIAFGSPLRIVGRVEIIQGKNIEFIHFDCDKTSKVEVLEAKINDLMNEIGKLKDQFKKLEES